MFNYPQNVVPSLLYYRYLGRECNFSPHCPNTLASIHTTNKLSQNSNSWHLLQ